MYLSLDYSKVEIHTKCRVSLQTEFDTTYSMYYKN